jgi:hypothetical protein
MKRSGPGRCARQRATVCCSRRSPPRNGSSTCMTTSPSVSMAGMAGGTRHGVTGRRDRWRRCIDRRRHQARAAELVRGPPPGEEAKPVTGEPHRAAAGGGVSDRHRGASQPATGGGEVPRQRRARALALTRVVAPRNGLGTHLRERGTQPVGAGPAPSCSSRYVSPSCHITGILAHALGPSTPRRTGPARRAPRRLILSPACAPGRTGASNLRRGESRARGAATSGLAHFRRGPSRGWPWRRARSWTHR